MLSACADFSACTMLKTVSKVVAAADDDDHNPAGKY
jgi:hypothetical protein